MFFSLFYKYINLWQFFALSQADASTVVSRVAAEFTNITKAILDLTIGEVKFN